MFECSWLHLRLLSPSTEVERIEGKATERLRRLWPTCPYYYSAYWELHRVEAVERTNLKAGKEILNGSCVINDALSGGTRPSRAENPKQTTVSHELLSTSYNLW